MRVHLRILMACAGLLTLPVVARAQTEVLDFDAIAPSFGLGLLSQDRTEFFYSLNGAGTDLNTLHAVSLINPGTTRQIPTDGIDVSQYRLERSAGRGLVSDSVNKAVYSVDFVGDGAPIPLSPEPGTGATLAPAGGTVLLPISGTASSSNPADRDQLYTRSILGGPAVEVTGGIPQNRQTTDYIFSQDGGTLAVGTRVFGDNTIPQTTKVFLATPGVTGLTPVLTSLPSSTRFITLGSDASGDHFAFYAKTTVNTLWSVPKNNPTSSVMLNRDTLGNQIFFENWMIDSVGSRMFFSHVNFSLPGSPTEIWSAPIDGALPATLLGRLPTTDTLPALEKIVGNSWLYVRTNNSPASAESRAYAVSLTGGPVVEFRDPNHIDVTQFAILPDGESVLFSDGRTAGNDLYLGRPGDTSSPIVTLFDVPNTDRLVRAGFSLDGKFAIAALMTAPVAGTSIADRLLAIPLDGGAPVTIDDGTVGPVAAQFDNAGYGVRGVANDQVFYLKGFSDGQAGFYLADLPGEDELEGDFNHDGTVDAADYVVWRKSDGAQNGYDTWRSHFGQTTGSGTGANASVPEPATALITLTMLAVCRMQMRGRAESYAS